MKQKRNILLTFDYELSLGAKSGTPENCMLRPTKLILQILKKHEAKAIFFIDTTYIQRLKEVSEISKAAKIDLKNITDQLIEIASNGHYLFHHIHPHWLDAVYEAEENQWTLENTTKFIVNSISEKERELVFLNSYEILSEILSKVKNAHTLDGYRAGGLYIEPFTVFKKYFIKYGINYEFSVIPNLVKKDETLFYDFSGCPKEPYYNFESQVSIKKDDGQFKEFTISQFQLSGIRKIVNGLYYRAFKLKQKQFGDGKSVSNHFNSSEKEKSIKRYFVSQNILSIELLNPILTPLFKKLVTQNKYLHFISHPKLLSEMNLKEFDILLAFAGEKHDIEYDFKNF